MKLIGRLVLLTACVLMTYAVPHINTNVLPSLSSITDMIAAQKACMKQFHEREKEINQQILIQSNECFVTSNQTSTNATIADEICIIRSNLATLQDNIGICTAITDDLAFVQCVQNENDENVQLLSSAQKLSKRVEAEINGSEEGNEASRILCLKNVSDDASRNYTEANDELNDCLNHIYK